MKSLNLLAAASALSLFAVPFALSPASAQGKSETSPAPGQQQMKPGSARTYAPGQMKPEGESAREFAPGQNKPEENSGRSSTVAPAKPVKKY